METGRGGDTIQVVVEDTTANRKFISIKCNLNLECIVTIDIRMRGITSLGKHLLKVDLKFQFIFNC